MRPLLLRPPDLVSGRTRDFSVVAVSFTTKSATLDPRRPGVVGLYLRIPMVLSSASSGAGAAEDVDRALAEGDDRALGVLALADAEPGATGLALAVHRVHGVDLDAEDLLDGDLDLGLVRAGVDDEGVLALVEQPVGLLRHDRRDQDVAGVLALAHLSSSTSASAAFLAGPFFAAAFFAGFTASSALGAFSAFGAFSAVSVSSAFFAAFMAAGFFASTATSRPVKVSYAALVNRTSSAHSTSYVLSW